MKYLSLPVESVRERDIDFLLVEELISSKAFVDYVIEKLELPSCDMITNIQRSVNDFGLGETDIFVGYRHGDLRIGILIENKLDAIFQPEQAERYSSRARQYEAGGRFDTTYEALIAPAQYINHQNAFSRSVSYEQLIEYFQNTSFGVRGEFKATLLTIASEKLRRGYVAVNSEPNQAFWQSYYRHLITELPLVSMKPVSVVPAGSDWIDLSIGSRRFVHKLKKGQIDFLSLEEIEIQRLENLFMGKTELLTFGDRLVLRIHTAPLDRMSDFQSQITAVQQCMSDIRTATAVL